MLVDPDLADCHHIWMEQHLTIQDVPWCAAGEVQGLEKQVQQLQASEAALSAAKASLESKLSEAEELLAKTQAQRDELQGKLGLGRQQGCAQVLLGCCMHTARCAARNFMPHPLLVYNSNMACVQALIADILLSCSAGEVATLTEQLQQLGESAAETQASLEELQQQHSEVNTHVPAALAVCCTTLLCHSRSHSQANRYWLSQAHHTVIGTGCNHHAA